MDELNATVLVVDDNRDIVEGIAILLEREGYNIIKAYDGLQAIDKLVSNSVQLILIDIMMPRLDGLSAIMKIREKNNIPIIVLSAKSEDTDKVLGLSMGADDYIAKPYNPMELTARVKANLRRYMTGKQGACDCNRRTGAEYEPEKADGGWRRGQTDCEGIQNTGAVNE